MSALNFVVAILAVYRLSFLIAREDGPFDLFARLRARVGQGTWVGRGLHCVLCVSFWLALAAALALRLATYTETLLAWQGIAGGVLFIHKFVEPG